MDAAGNASPTNSVAFTYVVTAPLSVQIVGSGTVNPNYNGQSLVIGQSYSMTATPAAGFAFSNWSGSWTTNKPTVAFVMASNLTLIATFVDVQKPVLTIKTPTTGEKWSNAAFTVTGTASDNVGVSQVLVTLNGGSWQTAAGTNAWQIAETLMLGTNTVQAFAVDAAGNASLTNSVSFVATFVSPPELTILLRGNQVILSWPAYATDYVLEATPSLTPATWAPVAGSIGKSGDQFVTTNNVTGNSSFYRLRSP